MKIILICVLKLKLSLVLKRYQLEPREFPFDFKGEKGKKKEGKQEEWGGREGGEREDIDIKTCFRFLPESYKNLTQTS